MNKILLVEDDATMISLLTTLLEIEGFEVVSLKEDNANHVFTLLENEKPSLVLLDVNLRAMNGFELLRTNRRNPVLKHTRVLMSSGMDIRDQCLQEGADGFIMKPYMPDDLIQIMRKTLAGA